MRNILVKANLTIYSVLICVAFEQKRTLVKILPVINMLMTFEQRFLCGFIHANELLAHLSRRLMGELIVYQSLRRPSVRPSSVRPSTFSNIFSSETTGPIKLKFHMETP